MTDVISGVYDVVEKVLSTASYLRINEEEVELLGTQMKSNGPFNFYDEEKEQDVKQDIYSDVIRELVASSINYCYWYGSHDIRPNGVSSTSMYNDVNEAFSDMSNTALNFEKRIQNLITILSDHRYPLLEERKRHLLELCEDRKAENFTHAVVSKRYSGEELLKKIIRLFSGFASDIFLKRTSLFFIQLYRRFGWYVEHENDLMYKLFVPADYQVPKVLRYFECIEFFNELEQMVDNKVLIPKGSLMEIQIRAATIKICKLLQDITKWPIPDIDTYLFCQRKLIKRPFHLTITSDY